MTRRRLRRGDSVHLRRSKSCRWDTSITATATDEDGNTSEFSACETVVEGGEPPTATVTLSATTAIEEAGAARVQLEDVPFTAILDAARRSNTAASPVNELPVNELPVNELPVNELPVNELGFLQLPDLLRSVPLSSIPLLRPGGWQAYLSTTALRGVPLTNVTLRDVLTLTPLPPGLDPAAPNDIRLSEIDFSRSPLGRLSAPVLVLGDDRSCRSSRSRAGPPSGAGSSPGRRSTARARPRSRATASSSSRSGARR